MLMITIVPGVGVFETTVEATAPTTTNTIPSTGTSIALLALAGPSPAPTSLSAKYMPKISGSHDIPTSAPPPPGSGLKNRGDQCCNSPTSRSTVIASVIIDGQSISRPMLTRSDVADMSPPSLKVL